MTNCKKEHSNFNISKYLSPERVDLIIEAELRIGQVKLNKMLRKQQVKTHRVEKYDNKVLMVKR